MVTGRAAVQAAGLEWQLQRARARRLARVYLWRDPTARLGLPATRVDPYPVYRQLRQLGTLVRGRGGQWVTASHPVSEQLVRDRRLGVREEVEPAPSGLSFLELNPPDHTRLRRLAAPAFAPARIRGYRARIEATVHRLLDRLEASGGGDLISGFAAPLPIAVITDLLGVPDADAGRFAHYGAVLGGGLDGVRSLRHARELEACNDALAHLFEELLALRRREPADDVISAIVSVEGEQVRPDEMVPLCALLLIAGFETTVNLVGNGVMALLSHPEQWRALCDEPGLAAKAVEETLRWDAPVQSTGRVALEPVEIDGRRLDKGTWVNVLLGGANRDPAVFARPDRFDISRGSAEHLAFSGGIHHCLGRPLARLEGAVAFEALAARLPGLYLAGPGRRRDTFVLRGWEELPVAVAGR